MDTTVASIIITLLAVILPKLGVQVGSADLTTTASTIIAVVSGIVAYIHTVKSKGLTAFGTVKQ